jgi:DNA segregation ATPase FtsK/SpoIIIE, S-DNA-T family
VAVTLQVCDVRAAIDRKSDAPQIAGNGSPSTALLGRLFHEVFATLVGSDNSRNFHAAIDEAEPELYEWQTALIKHAYHSLVGPRLRQHQAVLHHVTDQVQSFWDSIQELCHWLGELLWQMRLRGDEELSFVIKSEEPLVWEISHHQWTESVRLTGVANPLWRIPGTDHWCVIELKTGRTSPETDLAQACLYHQLLIASGESHIGNFSLVSFEPQKFERHYSASELAEAQTNLKNLIGTLAQVSPTENSQVEILSVGDLSIDASANSNHLQERLLDTFKEYGAEVKFDGPVIEGPAFLRYPITLNSRNKFRNAERLAKEIQVRLHLDAPPRIGAEGGRFVIDLQRPDRQPVHFSQIRSQLPASDQLLGCSQAPLGVGVDGKLRMIDFAQPEDAHLLIAGMAGSGKSEWLRTAVAGLMATNTPATLRFLIIDLKRYVFHALRNSPFLYCPIVFSDEKPIAQVLDSLAREMDHRYQLFAHQGDDTLASYVERRKEQMPRIFCICDEYADLISGDRQTRRTIEQQVVRLGQKARAAGIHLIFATNRPSRDIIKGVLDSYIPARVGLKMKKAIESKLLLSSPGAETLLGCGDLLFRDVGEPVRLQGVYLQSDEAQNVFSFSGFSKSN